MTCWQSQPFTDSERASQAGAEIASLTLAQLRLAEASHLRPIQVYALCELNLGGFNMAAEKVDAGPQVDPFEAFRGMRDKYLESMSKVMIDAVNSEEYAQATGAMLNNYLTLSAPFREALDKAMLMALEQFSLPSRQQVTALAERFTNLEMRLDDLDAKLDQILKSLSANRTPVAEASPSTRRPTSSDAKPVNQTNTRKGQKSI